MAFTDKFIKLLCASLVDAVESVAEKHAIANPAQLAEDIVTHMTDAPAKPAKKTKTEAAAEAPASDKRIVSAKMKKLFLDLVSEASLPNGETLLKEASKEYKTTDLTSVGGTFEGFAKSYIARIFIDKTVPEPAAKPAKKGKSKKEPEPEPEAAAPAAPAKPAKKGKSAKPETKTESRWEHWTATSTKLFSSILKENNHKVSDEIKAEFVEYLNSLPEDQYTAKATAGHMRDFVDTLATHHTGGGSSAASAGGSYFPKMEEEVDEDVVELTFQGEKYLVGEKTRRIYTESPAGDIQVGVCGEGRFADFHPTF